MPQAAWIALAVTSALGGTGASVYSSAETRTDAKKAANAQQQKVDKVIADTKAAEEVASTQASELVRRRALARTQTVFTNPMGIGGMANYARKSLLGQ